MILIVASKHEVFHRSFRYFSFESPSQILERMILRDYSVAHIILAGDFNTLPESEVIIRTSLTPIVTLPTRGYNKLDRIYVSDLHYDGVQVLKSAVKSDHLAIVAWSGSVKPAWRKARQASTFRNHTSAQHAHFLSRLSAADPISHGNDTNNPQAKCRPFWTSSVPSAQSPSHLQTRRTLLRVALACFVVGQSADSVSANRVAAFTVL